MFDSIHFYHYDFPKSSLPFHTPGSPAAFPADSPASIRLDQENIRHATFYQSGSIDIFLCPPCSEEVKQKFYYLDQFSIFTSLAGSFTKRRDYASYQLVYTLSGNGTLEYRGKTYPLSPGMLFLLDCKEPHLYRTEGDTWTYCVMHFDGPLMADYYQQFLTSGHSPVFTEREDHCYLHQIEKLLMACQKSTAFRDWEVSDIISSLLTRILLFCADSRRTLSPKQQKMQYLAAYLEQNYQKDFSLDELSAFCNLSKYHLSREFKQFTGFAPIEYLLHLRLNHARTFLASTDLPIKEVAQMTGFHDLNHFYRLFHAKFGCTPGNYRKNQIP